MRSLLISIKPKYLADILNGKKTIEIRKTKPQCDLPIDVYIYCTKEDSLIKLQERYKDRYVGEQNFKCEDFPKMYSGYEGKGKVVAKFVLNKIDLVNESADIIDIMLKSRLTLGELTKYLGNKVGYAWHIDNLEIFDRPKELSEFYTKLAQIGMNMNGHCCGAICGIPLKRPPQSYQFIEVY